MSLKIKLLLAQLPLVAAMLLVGTLALRTIGELGDSSQTILKDNYRSILAAERMQSGLGALLYRELRRCAKIAPQSEDEQNERQFERELSVQENNITEPGEAEATAKLRGSWEAFRGSFKRSAVGDEAAADCLERWQRLSADIRTATEKILELNQDAMVYKSEHAHDLSRERQKAMLLALLIALSASVWASVQFTERLLRPMGVLSQTARRLASGDFQARAQLNGKDEIAAVAKEFNAMADHLLAYQYSSLGELLQAQQLTQATIDGLPDPVLLVRPGGELLGSNERADTVFALRGRGSSALIADILPESIRRAVDKGMAHVLSGKGPYAPSGYEEAVRLEGADGASSFLPRANPVYDDRGSIAGVAVILQDISRERRFDELRSDLVATIAHEFRTPITSLRMSLYILSQETAGALNEKQAELVAAGRQDTERLHGLVEELLELSRLEQGQAETQRTPVAPATLANDAILRNGRLGEESQVTVQNEISPFLPEVLVDPDRVPLILDNLLSNAIRYSPRQGTVYLRAHIRDRAVHFTVTDSGPGIAAEYRERIFEKFYRVPGASGGSAGLGLFIAREVVRAHGGDIGLESEAGRGSSFWFTLPQVA